MRIWDLWGWMLWPSHAEDKLPVCFSLELPAGFSIRISGGEAVRADNSQDKFELKSSWMLLALVGPSNQQGNPFSLDTWHSWILSQHLLPQAVFKDSQTRVLISLI